MLSASCEPLALRVTFLAGTQVRFICVMVPDQHPFELDLDLSSKFGLLMDHFREQHREQQGKDGPPMRFFFEADAISADYTVADLELRAGDVIAVVETEVGIATSQPSNNPSTNSAGAFCSITPLTAACSDDNLRRVRKLLSAGAAVNEGITCLCDESTWTPLVEAAMGRGNVELMEILLQAGADADATDYCGHTLLDKAVSAAMKAKYRFDRCELVHHRKIVHTLLRAGARASSASILVGLTNLPLRQLLCAYGIGLGEVLREQVVEVEDAKAEKAEKARHRWSNGACRNQLLRR
ncbi:hypothetical protein T492DRAFT_1119280 [Pavlovales sp. CCMP2436]|nr:hypothetical protein T492DRAFT_1119280 [Pavlovales sp. CCMP2436]